MFNIGNVHSEMSKLINRDSEQKIGTKIGTATIFPQSQGYWKNGRCPYFPIFCSLSLLKKE